MSYEYDDKTKWVILISLFVALPLIFVIDLYIIINFLMDDFDLHKVGGRGKFGLFFIFIVCPAFLVFCLKAARANKWLSKKKKNRSHE